MPALSPDGRLVAYAVQIGPGDRITTSGCSRSPAVVPLRLTDDPADDVTPDFSPDGSQIAFRSERGGGGVYLVSALGGSARLIAPEGRQPRFSPDGTRIAYWSGQWRGEGARPGIRGVCHLPRRRHADGPCAGAIRRTPHQYGLGTAGRCSCWASRRGRRRHVRLVVGAPRRSTPGGDGRSWSSRSQSDRSGARVMDLVGTCGVRSPGRPVVGTGLDE